MGLAQPAISLAVARGRVLVAENNYQLKTNNRTQVPLACKKVLF